MIGKITSDFCQIHILVTLRGFIMAWLLTAQLRDGFGRRGSKQFELRAADYTAADAARTNILPLFQAVTGMEILSSTLSEQVPFVGTLTAGSNKDAGVTISGSKPDGYLANVKVPAPFTATYVNGDGSVDLTEVSLAAFLDIYETIGGNAYLSDGETIDTWVRGTLDT